jgi:hypothetical protein
MKLLNYEEIINENTNSSYYLILDLESFVQKN